MRHYGPASSLCSRRGCFAASGALVASIGEKWYYFEATSALGYIRALLALGPSGVRFAPPNTTFSLQLTTLFIRLFLEMVRKNLHELRSVVGLSPGRGKYASRMIFPNNLEE